jgi:hypothetical protein
MFQEYVDLMNKKTEAEQSFRAETHGTGEVTEVRMEVTSPAHDAGQNSKYKQSTSPKAPV